MNGNVIYLDNQTATAPSLSSIEKLSLRDTLYGGGLSSHKMGQDSRSYLKKAQEIIFQFLDYEEENILFSSSYSEIISSLYTHIYLDKLKLSGKNHIMVLPCERATITSKAQRLEEFGLCVQNIPLNEQGQIDIEGFKKTLNPKTGFVSLSMADDLTGVIYPIEEISKICTENDILLHVDVSSTLGKVHFNKYEIDYLTIDAKKIHVGTSCGLCISKAKIEETPSIDIAGIYAFAFAIQQSMLFLDQMGLEVVRKRNLLEKLLQDKLEVKTLFKDQIRLPNVLCLCFAKIHQQTLHYLLNEKQVFASIGTGEIKPIDKILKMAKVNDYDSHSAISFALSRFTTDEDIEKAASIIIETTEKLLPLTEDIL